MKLSAKRRAQWQWKTAGIGLAEGAARLVMTDQGSLEVVRLGRGDPLVLLPGLAGGWRLVAPLARRLARSHEVILCNLRGDVRPLSTPGVEDLGAYARDVASLIEGLRLERPAVFGVSFGGAVALELAVERPGLIGALGLYGVEASFRVGLGTTIARKVLERYPLPADSGFVNQFFNLLHGGVPESASLAEFVVERIWETDQGVMARRLKALEGWSVADRLWTIDVPTLVLGGSRDVIVPPTRQKALAGAIPGARFVEVEGAGHVGFLTHRAAVAAEARQWTLDAHHSAL